jgi:argininosuccinate lyase
MTLLTVMKGLPLAYNKDMQEDKEAIFDAVDTVKMCLSIFTRMLDTMKVKSNNMLAAAKGGFTNATDLADYLVKKGIPFRDSHEIVGRMVAYCIMHQKNMDELDMTEFKNFSDKIEDDVYEAIKLQTCVSDRKTIGGLPPKAFGLR